MTATSGCLALSVPIQFHSINLPLNCLFFFSSFAAPTNQCHLSVLRDERGRLRVHQAGEGGERPPLPHQPDRLARPRRLLVRGDGRPARHRRRPRRRRLRLGRVRADGDGAAPGHRRAHQAHPLHEQDGPRPPRAPARARGPLPDLSGTIRLRVTSHINCVLFSVCFFFFILFI